tara:strand:+ start:21953 stop:22237 length:285 start_codon:yes stop_codon:yes gene_type:complete
MTNRLRQIHAIAKGRVQKVGYRNFCVEQATGLGITGYAQNLSNGDVKIVAEGGESILREYIKLLRKGPILALVKEVEFRWEEPENKFKGFEIKI